MTRFHLNDEHGIHNWDLGDEGVRDAVKTILDALEFKRVGVVHLDECAEEIRALREKNKILLSRIFRLEKALLDNFGFTYRYVEATNTYLISENKDERS